MGSQSVRVLRRRVLGRGLREPEEAMTELMMAKFMQEASLSVISQIIQPTLLNFLR